MRSVVWLAAMLVLIPSCLEAQGADDGRAFNRKSTLR